MLTAFSLLLLATAVFYAGLIGRMAWGLRRVLHAPAPTRRPDEAWPFVSVVVAARDEEEAVEACLRALLENDYPAGRFEVLLVDDFSTDATPRIVRRLQRAYAGVLAGEAAGDDAPEGDAFTLPLRLLPMREVAEASAGHKQAALAHGIRQARGQILLTTDADCAVGPRWLRSMVNRFDEETAFVAGPVRYRPGKTLFGRMQALEFMALVAFGAGAIGAGRPNICNSANVAYGREAYARYGRPAHKGSPHPADDELLLQRLAEAPEWRVRFCADPDALVEAEPVHGIRAFLAQRTRWSSMSARYPSAVLVASVALLYAFYVLLLAVLGAVWFWPALWPPLLLSLGLKMAAEATMTYPAARHYGQGWLFRYFPLAQLFQIPYVVYVGAAGALGQVHWKGRRVQ